MARPEYVNSGAEPSIETWQEACAISQEWADGARRAAQKRHWRYVAVAYLTMVLIIAALAWLALIITRTP